MTGPEHYQAAEDLLREVGGQHGDAVAAMLARAQVHAALALAAATALGAEIHGDNEPGFAAMDRPDVQAWKKVAAVKSQRGPYVPPRR